MATHNVLKHAEFGKLTIALKKLQGRIKQEQLTQTDAAAILSQQLPFTVTIKNIATAMDALDWKGWPTSQGRASLTRKTESRRLTKLEGWCDEVHAECRELRRKVIALQGRHDWLQDNVESRLAQLEEAFTSQAASDVDQLDQQPQG